MSATPTKQVSHGHLDKCDECRACGDTDDPMDLWKVNCDDPECEDWSHFKQLCTDCLQPYLCPHCGKSTLWEETIRHNHQDYHVTCHQEATRLRQGWMQVSLTSLTPKVNGLS